MRKFLVRWWLTRNWELRSWERCVEAWDRENLLSLPSRSHVTFQVFGVEHVYVAAAGGRRYTVGIDPAAGPDETVEAVFDHSTGAFVE